MKKAIVIFLSLFPCFLLNAQTADYDMAKAQAHLDEGRYREAIVLSEKALLNNNDYRLYLIVGKANKAIGDIENALDAFQTASSLAPGSGDYYAACIFSTLGKTELAIAHLKSNLKSDYKIAEKDLLLNTELKTLESETEWKNIISGNWYSEIERGIAEAEYLAKNKRSSELQNLIAYHKQKYNGSAGIEYMMALYSGVSGDKKSELTHYRSASAESGSRTVFLAFIDVLLSEKQFFEASELSSRAFEAFPAEKDFILLKARSLKGVGDYNEAMKLCQHFLDISPANENGLSLAGDIAYAERSYSEALKLYSTAIELYPGNPDNYINRANTYSSTSTWEFAISDYSMALDLDPTNADVYYNKANALLKTGNRDSACRNFRMALKYGNKKASQAINRNCIR